MRAIIFIFAMQACGQPDLAKQTVGSLKTDINTERYRKDIEGTIRAQGEAFGVPSWAQEAKRLNIEVISVPYAYVNCSGIQGADGCTHYDTEQITVRVSIYPWMRSFGDTSIEHELRHVYLCVIEGDCDRHHLRREWSIAINNK